MTVDEHLILVPFTHIHLTSEKFHENSFYGPEPATYKSMVVILAGIECSIAANWLPFTLELFHLSSDSTLQVRCGFLFHSLPV